MSLTFVSNSFFDNEIDNSNQVRISGKSIIHDINLLNELYSWFNDNNIDAVFTFSGALDITFVIPVLEDRLLFKLKFIGA